MSAENARPPEPTPEHRLLDAFVGTWRTEGRMEAGPLGPAAAIRGTDRYEWLPGGFFLVHRVDVRMGDEQVNTIEIIGWDPESRTYPMRWFDGRGGSGTYHAAFRDGAWTFAGETERFTGRFAADGGTISGTWERTEDGSEWLPWMEINLTKDSAAVSATDDNGRAR